MTSAEVSPWRGVLMLNSGTVPRDREVAKRIQKPPATPSLHVGGGVTDFTHEEQLGMLDAWSPGARNFIEHAEGHVPPTAKSPAILDAIRAWVQQLAPKQA